MGTREVQMQHCLLCAELRLNVTRPVPVHTSLPLKHDRREPFAVLPSSRLSYLELTVNQVTLQEAFTSLRLGAQDRLGVPPGHHKKLNPIPSFVLRTRSLIPNRRGQKPGHLSSCAKLRGKPRAWTPAASQPTRQFCIATY